MYDQRQKAIRDRAYELKMAIAEGEERGEQRGEQRGIALGEERGKVLGTLNTLEELLGLPITSTELANSLNIDTLKFKADSLRSRLRDRS
jgi:predicted transposase YdaD